MKCFGKHFGFFISHCKQHVPFMTLAPALKIVAMSAFTQAFMCPWPVLLNELWWMCLSSFSTRFSLSKNVLTKQLQTDL